MMNVMTTQIDMPKILNVEIKPYGFGYRIWLRGVMLKRPFLTYQSAVDYIPEIHNYFGDDCQMILKEVA